MKNALLSFLMCALLFSCKKDERLIQTQKTYDVKFAVTAFEHEIVDFETGSRKQYTISDTEVKDHINQLAFVVYDQSGNEVAREVQTKLIGKFGFYGVSLPDGEYTAVVVGSKASFGINRVANIFEEPFIKSNLSSAFMAYEQGDFETRVDIYYKTDDTFFKKVKFSVQSEEYGETRSIVLERIVGKLEFQIEDVATFNVSILNDASAFKFESETPFLFVDEDLVSGGSGILVDASKPRPFYLMDNNSPTRIEISSGNKRFIIAVPIHKNKRTIVKGKILGHSGQTPFAISVSDKWSTDSLVVNL